MSDEKIKRLVHTEGKTRTLEMDDGSVVEREGGSVSWRNNNPGNLKFAYAGSADRTDHAVRTREQALADAQKRYRGVVGLDQWGNAVFESYEAGRAAKMAPSPAPRWRCARARSRLDAARESRGPDDLLLLGRHGRSDG